MSSKLLDIKYLFIQRAYISIVISDRAFTKPNWSLNDLFETQTYPHYSLLWLVAEFLLKKWL